MRRPVEMRRQPIEEMLELMGEEAIQEKVRDNKIIAACWSPREHIRVVQPDALPGLLSHAPNAPLEDAQHGTAGVDYIRSKFRIRLEQALQKASVTVS